MEMSLFSVLFFGFLLGVQHAVEPDHVIAVSTIASRSKKLWHSSLAGVFWGIGHTATLFVVGTLLLVLEQEIPRLWSLSMELAVGFMLIVMGISNILFHMKPKHQDSTSHTQRPARSLGKWSLNSSYLKSALVGIIHGLAGSAAMALLAMSTMKNAWSGIYYILVFGAGTVTGMLLFTTLIGIPFAYTAKQASLHRGLTRLSGWVSSLYGLYYIYLTGKQEELFFSWLP